MTLAEYADRWLTELIGRRPRTIESYRSGLVLHVLPRLGAKQLRKLDADDIVALARELYAQGYAAWTVDTILKPLKTLFRHAVRRDVLAASVFHKLERSELPRPWTPDQRVLSAAEIGRLLAAASPRYRILLASAIFTGLRQSELLALRWHRTLRPRTGCSVVWKASERPRSYRLPSSPVTVTTSDRCGRRRAQRTARRSVRRAGVNSAGLC